MMFWYRIVIIDYILSVFVVVLLPELVSFLPGVFGRPIDEYWRVPIKVFYVWYLYEFARIP
jgi:hypothetical protein